MPLPDVGPVVDRTARARGCGNYPGAKDNSPDCPADRVTSGPSDAGGGAAGLPGNPGCALVCLRVVQTGGRPTTPRGVTRSAVPKAGPRTQFQQEGNPARRAPLGG